MESLIKERAVTRVAVRTTVRQLETALNLENGPLGTTPGELEGTLEERCHILLQRETELQEIDIEELIDDENFEEE